MGGKWGGCVAEGRVPAGPGVPAALSLSRVVACAGCQATLGTPGGSSWPQGTELGLHQNPRVVLAGTLTMAGWPPPEQHESVRAISDRHSWTDDTNGLHGLGQAISCLQASGSFFFFQIPYLKSREIIPYHPCY